MHHFQHRGDDLYCEDVPVARIVEAVGTPAYIYSHATLTRHYRMLDEAFQAVPHLICFALKANANLAVLKLFADLGGGMDVVSGGELYRALRAGVAPDRIVYAGVGKTREEIADALKANILMFNVESDQELRTINAVAAELGLRARVALRVNPDVDPKTHPYIATGLKQSKFGIDIHRALEEYAAAARMASIDVVGIHQHIGSQITSIQPFVDSLTRTAGLVRQLRGQGTHIRYIDIGGGLGITYQDETPPLPGEFARALIDVIKDLDATVVLEPGRLLVGNAGILVTRVLYTKQSPVKNFLIVDAGMNDLARPSLYGSYHAIWRARRVPGREEIIADVVGPICESGDFLAKERLLPRFEPGELMAIMSAGAYGHTMSSNYNARPRAPEVMVRGDRFFVVRERESYADLMRGEHTLEEVQ
ncbi:MAG TPA: diaminopimelate decarboxylase [Candidatus Baltobacteraceae bacterium]|nr:diaminopimelate decarboxylase [Candidatus Baltobacteraceae bacterium]